MYARLAPADNGDFLSRDGTLSITSHEKTFLTDQVSMGALAIVVTESRAKLRATLN